MILGIIVSILIGALIALIGYFVYDSVCSNIAGKAVAIATIVLVVVTIGFGGFAGCSMENAEVEKTYYGYLAVKQTYESAVNNQDIGGLERLEITKVAMEQNGYIAKKKVDMGKWYSFAIKGENKALILSLEPIE